MGLFSATSSSYLRAQGDRAWQHTARTAESAAHAAQLAGADARRAATAAAGRLGALAGTVGGAITAAALSDDSVPDDTTRIRFSPQFVDELAEDVEDRLAEGQPLRRALARSLRSYTPLLLEEPRESRSWLRGLGLVAAVAIGAELASRAIAGRGIIALIGGASEPEAHVWDGLDDDGSEVIGGPRPVPDGAYVKEPVATSESLLPVTQEDLSTELDVDDLAAEGRSETEDTSYAGGDGSSDMTPPPEIKRL